MEHSQDQWAALEASIQRIDQLESRWREAKREARLWRITAAALLLLGVGFSSLRTSPAQGQGTPVTLDGLNQRLTNLEQVVIPMIQQADSDLQSQVIGVQQDDQGKMAMLTGRVKPLEDKLARVTVKNGGADIYLGENGGANLHIVNGVGHTNALPSDPASASGLGNLVIGYQEGDPGLQTGSHHIQLGPSRVSLQQGPSGGEDVYFESANLHILNGMGKTDSTNGLGNLIVGYNESRGVNNDTRTGSHNLVVGMLNNYASYGGLVSGYGNEIDGVYASVTGGVNNTASGPYSSVTGGGKNLANGYASSISGGQLNQTDALCGSISGCYKYWQQGDKFNGWHVTNFDTGKNGLPEKPGP